MLKRDLKGPLLPKLKAHQIKTISRISKGNKVEKEALLAATGTVMRSPKQTKLLLYFGFWYAFYSSSRETSQTLWLLSL